MVIKKIIPFIKKIKNSPPPVKAAFWFTLCSVINKGIQLITVPIFTRLLTTTEYGEYSIFVSWQSIILIIATLNIHCNVINNAFVKFPHKKDEYISSMQGLTTTISLVLIAVFTIFNKPISDFIGLPPFLIYILLIEIMLTPGFELWAAKERFDYKYKKVVAATLFLLIMNPLLGLVFVHFANEKGYARILSVLVVQLVLYGLFYILNLKKNRSFFSKDKWKYALSLTIPLVPHYLSQTLLSQMDRIMISDMISTDKAGIYSVAYSSAMLLQIVGKSIQSAFTPWIYKKIKNEKTEDIKGVVNCLVILVGALNFIIICLAPEVIMVLGGAKYSEAIYVIPPVVCSSLLIFLYSMFCTIEFYFEKSKAMMVVSVFGAAVNYITNYFFIPIFGYYAAGFTTLFCYIIFVILHSFVMKSALKKNGHTKNVYDMKFIWSFVVLFIAISIGLMFIYENFLIRYLIIFIFVVAIVLTKNKWIKYISVVKEKDSV